MSSAPCLQRRRASRYYPSNALSNLISVTVLFLAYTADVLGPRDRTAGTWGFARGVD